jgi:hypothetical protein
MFSGKTSRQDIWYPSQGIVKRAMGVFEQVDQETQLMLMERD